MKKYMLCGRPGSCCPSVEYELKTDYVYITDDGGDIVKMTKEQFKILKGTKYDFL